MGRFFIDSQPRPYGDVVRFRVLIEEGGGEYYSTHEDLAKLLGVEAVDPLDVVEGALFVSGSAKPVAHLTDERRKLFWMI